MEAKEIDYEVAYRDVKYPRVEFKTGKLLLVLPEGEQPEKIIEKHKNWIKDKIEFIEECLEASKNKQIFERSEEEFRNLVYSFVEEISEKLNIKVNKIFFKRMKSKWASCSAKKNLTINMLLKYLPEKLIEYVIFHEVVHIIEKRHNKKFWKIISKEFPDYEEMEKELFIYWFALSINQNLY